MEIRRQPAQPALRPYVRSFAQRRMSLRGTVVTQPLPARPDQFIEFYLADRYAVGRDGGSPSPAPGTAVVGPQSRPGVELHMSGAIEVFTIRFQPTGFHRMFGVAMPALTDHGIAIGDVLGRRAIAIDDAVRRAVTFEKRVEAAEHWLLDQAEASAGVTAFDHAARLLAAARGRARIDAIAARSGLGARQFQRRFTTAVGISPKLYARTLRLENALAAHRIHPGRGWAAIAHHAGYADQAHFIRDCRSLTGAPPSGFIAADDAALSEMFNPRHG